MRVPRAARIAAPVALFVPIATGLLVAAAIALSGCPLVHPDSETRQCLKDIDCFEQEGEYCDLDTKTCSTGEGVFDPNKRYGACVDRIAMGSDPDKGHIGGLAALLAVALAAQRRRPRQLGG